jgi:hypothetical protein
MTHVDKNMNTISTIDLPDAVFHDVRKEPFQVYGLYEYKNVGLFRRIPEEVARATSPSVLRLHTNTAGGRVRFSTDSDFVAIRAVMPFVCRFNHMPLTASAGFDLYIDDPVTGISRYHRTFRPPLDMEGGYESVVQFSKKMLRHFTIHFPSYSDVASLHIGLQPNAQLGQGMAYRAGDPVVYYGSSITQGACASRPGNAYQNVIARQLNMDYVNLGFSGAGKAEPSIVEYMPTLPMSAFVCDYDHNAPDWEYLKSTHFPLYQAIRTKRPDIPYIMVSRPDFDCDTYDKNILRRKVIQESYHRARKQGDNNVYFVDGNGIFRGPFEDMCTVDAIHPNDLGFARMADAIGCELRRAFTQPLF